MGTPLVQQIGKQVLCVSISGHTSDVACDVWRPEAVDYIYIYKAMPVCVCVWGGGGGGTSLAGQESFERNSPSSHDLRPSPPKMSPELTEPGLLRSISLKSAATTLNLPSHPLDSSCLCCV